VARGRRRRDEVIAGFAWPAEPAGTDPRILDGLRDWLHACLAGAPSQFATLPSAFGERVAPSSVADLSPTRRRDGLWRTWTILCRREGIDDVRPDRLPRLFTADAETGVPDGAVWEVANASPPSAAYRAPSRSRPAPSRRTPTPTCSSPPGATAAGS
jgi:hypothetical protein